MVFIASYGTVLVKHQCEHIYILYGGARRDKLAPVTTSRRFLRLRMEERPLIWRLAANVLNKQSRTAEKMLSSSLGGWRDAINSSSRILLRNVHTVILGAGLALWYESSKEKGS